MDAGFSVGFCIVGAGYGTIPVGGENPAVGGRVEA